MGRSHKVVKAKEEVLGVEVKNKAREKLGKIEEVLLEKESGRVAYAVLGSGGILGMGEKYFAVPWNALHYDVNEKCYDLNIDVEKLKKDPGFNKDRWPDMADSQWG